MKIFDIFSLKHKIVIKRFIIFFFKHIFINTRFLLLYSVFYFRKNAYISVDCYNYNELGENIKNGKSLIRFGDGEIFIINYGSIHYEKYNAVLRKIFLQIMHDYKKNKDKYIIGINDWVLSSSNKDLKKRGTFQCWMPYKVSLFLHCDLKQKYFDAILFYRNKSFEKYVLPYIKDKNIILISRKDNCEHIKFVNFFKNIKYVVTPDVNSFSEYGNIEKEIDMCISQYISNGSSIKSIVLLVACGPTSKVLCFNYSLKGIQSLDIGKGTELIGTGKDLEYMIL